jgi:hypothetical protein
MCILFFKALSPPSKNKTQLKLFCSPFLLRECESQENEKHENGMKGFSKPHWKMISIGQKNEDKSKKKTQLTGFDFEVN